jgi:hypothetical protein
MWQDDDLDINEENEGDDDGGNDGEGDEMEHVIQVEGEGNDQQPLQNPNDMFNNTALRAALSETVEEDSDGPDTSSVVRTINIPDIGILHKATVVAHLNTNPSGVSMDRLKRVRQANVSSSAIVDDQNSIALFDDIAVHTKNDKKHEWKLGRIQRIRNTEKSTVEYQRPKLLDNKNNKIKLMLNMYTRENDSWVYQSSSDRLCQYCLDQVVMKVSMEKNELSFKIKVEDEEQLNHFISNITNKKDKRDQKRSHSTSANNTVDGIGKVVKIHIPNVDTSSGLRQSTRITKSVSYKFK